MAKIPIIKGLEGRTIVITGAASGIGGATAELFIDEGARVILLDLNAAGVEAALGSGEGLARKADITNYDEVVRIIDEAASFTGGVDGVVNAAGILLFGPTLDMTIETWNKVIDVNLSGSFHVIKACLPWLKQKEGATIVNIASGDGLLPSSPGLAAYAASKGGVVALTKALAADLAPSIRVNCVCPGPVDTPMVNGLRAEVGNYALKRIADPVEIARAILFLTASQSSFVTGATLAVDGGRTFH
ncbi:SDR family oxidoreductase [Mesorhizobium sp. M0954]|uniref:SDR family NAD(P)-dependent oxidoreductase n=1 Tax=Mesorhizobium sp. M0954 TaxID=2957032 RepID=UPI0033367295